MILSVCNLKGGVGKTTIAVNLACRMAAQGTRVLIVDGDPNGCVVKWHAIKESQPVDVFHHPEKTLHRQISRLAEGYDHVILDTPPALGPLILSALVVSHAALIPVEVSPLSHWPQRAMWVLLKTAKKYNPALEILTLLTRRIPSAKLGPDQWEEQGLSVLGRVLDSTIHNRADFVRAMATGASIFDLSPESRSSREVEAVLQEIEPDRYDNASLLHKVRPTGPAETQEESRQSPRQERLVAVDFVVQGRAHRGFIRNISKAGAFIETGTAFSAGEKITLTFEPRPGHPPVRVSGVICRVEPNGIGVRFSMEPES